jgi:hypothetical protein
LLSVKHPGPEWMDNSRILSEVCRITSSSENDGAVHLLSLAILFKGDPNHSIALLQETSDASLLEDRDAVRLGDRKVLEALHLGIGNDHARELGAATVRTRLRVTT